ncbi:hypothetical protein ACFQ6B_03000 [Streptomyces wedmorensis]|uniref:Uncharacterized protein n=1 Tax=Streptomyces wedmorensis TaxID=43759 RepID=A0ABW6J0R9_STRWE
MKHHPSDIHTLAGAYPSATSTPTRLRTARRAEAAHPGRDRRRTTDAPRLNGPTATTSLGDRQRRKALPLGLAASLVAAVSFAGLAAWQHQEAQRAEQQTRQAQRSLDVVGDVLAAPDAETVHGKATNGALTTVVTSAGQNKAA